MSFTSRRGRALPPKHPALSTQHTPAPVNRARTLCAAVAMSLGFGAQANDQEHARAIAQARSGQFAPALETLERIVAANPHNTAYLHDQIAVLSWSGRDEAASELSKRIDVRAAPEYVLEALAVSARRLQQYGIAENLYREVIKRSPKRVAPRYGLAMSLAALKREGEGRAVLAALEASNDRLLAQALYCEHIADHAAAIGFYDQVLARDPKHREALIGKIKTGSRMGAAHVAYDLAANSPGLLSKAELDDLLAERTALDIRWATAVAAVNPKADRFADLDRAIAATDTLEKRLETAATEPMTAGELRMLFDRIVALTDRFRMKDSLRLHERMSTLPGIKLPSYVDAAAGHAALYLEKPQRAIEHFEAALAAGDQSAQTQTGYFYALNEAERPNEALKHADRMAGSQPKHLNSSDQKVIRTNPHYVAAKVLAASARNFANAPANAERSLSAIAAEVPRNDEVRIAAAATMQHRGQPRRAAAELAEVIANDPDNAGARAERVAPLIDSYQFAAAEREVQEALARRPEDKRVQSAERLWSLHGGPQVVIEGVTAQSRGNAPSGSRDRAVDGFLYAPPIDYNWRPFAHTHIAQGKYSQGTAEVNRAGAGVEYRGHDVRATVEASGGWHGNDRVGGAVGARWAANDHWYLGAKGEAQSNEIPLQARLYGYTASRGSLETEYRFDESRAIALSGSVLHISDGNDRQALYGTWDERLYASPRIKLDFRLGLYASRNSSDSAPYFNPKSDFSPEATLSVEWLTWREYRRAFTQRLAGTLGNYRQAGVGSGPISGFRYEHIWDIDNRFDFRYGIGRLVHPYDGRQSGRNYLTLGLDARF